MAAICNILKLYSNSSNVFHFIAGGINSHSCKIESSSVFSIQSLRCVSNHLPLVL